MATEQEYLDQLKTMKRRPSTPGDLLADLIECNNLTQAEVALRIGVSRATINRVIQGHRVLTPELAHRLSRFFSSDPTLWLSFQKQVDLWDALHMDTTLFEDIEPLQKVA